MFGRCFATACVVVLTSGLALAQVEPRPATQPGSSPLGFEARLQASFGGDNVFEVTYSDGSTSDLKLGSHTALMAGLFFSPWHSGGHSFEFELLAGWASNSTGPENTEDRIGLSRFPVELLAFYRANVTEALSIRLGLGPSYHFISSISGSGSLDDIDIDVDNALGAAAELAVGYTPWIASMGVRYTRMRYSFPVSGQDLDASSLGVFLSLWVPPHFP